MRQRSGGREPGGDAQGLIWARDDTVVTSTPTAAPDIDGSRTYYVKVLETGEIFELGEEEYQIWQIFGRGVSLDEAERMVIRRFSPDCAEHFSDFVAELAMRGLLLGAIPEEVVEQFSETDRARRLSLRDSVDPQGNDRPLPYNRIRLFDVNRSLGFLARWFGFLKYAVWPIVFLAAVAALMLFKHAAQLYADYPPKVLVAGGFLHVLFTLFTLNIARCVVMGAVMRHYGVRITSFSLEFVFGFYPRFRTARSGILQLSRERQLWALASPLIVRLAFFAFGVFGWWWFRADSTVRSALCIVLLKTAMLDLIIAALPILKSEIYYWFVAYSGDQYLQERAWAVMRSFFLRDRNRLVLSPLQHTALVTYGLSQVAAFLLVGYCAVNLLIGWTDRYQGIGFTLYLALLSLFLVWVIQIRRGRKRQLVARDERRAQRRMVRRGEFPGPTAPVADK
jgi:hypothetical protein